MCKYEIRKDGLRLTKYNNKVRKKKSLKHELRSFFF